MSDFRKSCIGSFSEELQALIDYGHDCCARIDDRIYECCQRIREAHEREIGVFELALTWKDTAPLPQYDVLDNERHKAVCKLREMPDCYPSYSAFPFAKWYEDLSTALGIDKGEVSCVKVRDTLIHLLGGDAMEEADAVDAGRCDETNAAVGVPAADKRRADCDDNQPSEEVASITTELREWASVEEPYKYGHQLTAIADRIDAEHERQLEVLYRDMSDAEYVKLPKDADGEPIHIGDVMENIVCPSVHREVMGVGVECFYGWDDGNGRYSQFDANCYCHHHAPTVEDVLREFICDHEEGVRDEVDLIADYAAKLRLAGDAE